MSIPLLEQTMSLLAARLAGGKSATHIQTTFTTRSYSIFAKPGGGRFFTSAKPPKTVTSTSTGPTTTTNASITNPSDTSKSVSSATSGQVDSVSREQPIKSPSDAQPNVVAVSASSEITSKHTSANSKQSISVAPGFNDSPLPSATNHAGHELPFLHPQPTHKTVLLHSFFSLDRPLLLLPLHNSQPLFYDSRSLRGRLLDDGETPINDMESISSDPQVDLASGVILPSVKDESVQLDEELTEQDANASRLLGRTYTVNRVGSFVDWQQLLKRFGDAEATAQIEGIEAAATEATVAAESWNVAMDSVKRKRKRKMNKHIYKKRRKRERSQRRRLGK